MSDNKISILNCDCVGYMRSLPDAHFDLAICDPPYGIGQDWKKRENNRVVTIEPVEEKPDCTAGLRGILSDYPEMSVDKFLERKYADKELDR